MSWRNSIVSTHPMVSVQADLVPTCRELGIAFLAYSPLGRGQLTGLLNMANLSPGDFRNHSPRFSKEALERVSCPYFLILGPFIGKPTSATGCKHTHDAGVT